MAKLVDNLNEQYEIIFNNRIKIAELKRDKITGRASAWENATGIADQKKDYVRAAVADIDIEIDIAEAEIERAYNRLKLADYELMGETADG